MALSLSSLASQRAEPNAFLDKKVNGVSGLIIQVETDRDVCDRYERHFGMGRSDVLKYFGSLHLAKLNAPGVYRIYGVDDQGVIHSHMERLKSGSLVFADKKGYPILDAPCGNAMVPGTDIQNALVSPSVSETSAALQTISLTTPVSEVLGNQASVITPGSPVAVEPIIPTPTTTTSSRNQGVAVIPALLAALGGGAAVTLNSSGGAPVPEPASLLVVLGMIGAMRLRRKRR